MVQSSVQPVEASAELVLIHRQFSANAAARADAAGFEDEHGAITFGELERRSNRVANALISRGVPAGARVVLCLKRGADFAIWALGVLKAGAAFVPIDPGYPEERRAFIVRDVSAALVVTHAEAASEAVAAAAERSPLVSVSGAELAYGIYTSGSTGRPKCVAVAHASLARYASALRPALGVGPSDRCLVSASFAFSASIRQLLAPLSVGACVVLADSARILNPVELLRYAGERRVTVLDTVPSYLRQCIEALERADALTRAQLGDSLRLVATTGEPLPTELVKRWRACMGARARIVNLYGQTETTGSVSAELVGDEALVAGDFVRCGPMLPGSRAYVVDEEHLPAKPGAPGELCIVGTSLAQGYLGRPGLTAERLVPAIDAPTAAPGERAYRTGDVVRTHDRGAFQFGARLDHQVKINGIRIELGEIEATLRRHAEVRDAVVQAQPYLGATRLVAYVAAPNAHGIEGGLRELVRRSLPDYMMPGAFVRLDALPRLASGKLDRQALPPPEQPAGAGAPTDGPRSTLERVVMTAWAETLGREDIALDADFFELGADSMQAIKAVSRLMELLPVTLPLVAIFFENPTVEGIARAIEEEIGADAARELVRGIEERSVE